NVILSSLCYFSIFFAPFFFPILLYLICEGEVKYHAKKAFWTHLIPYLSIIIGFILPTSIFSASLMFNSMLNIISVVGFI
ncbi:DUF4870 domain-containing protein, partial [Bacillus cereus]|uniref:DUF4870 domain-containing protein n=1 Tax=Bacillus cereus TaxID=1396 RepID=UPI001F0AE10A